MRKHLWIYILLNILIFSSRVMTAQDECRCANRMVGKRTVITSHEIDLHDVAVNDQTGDYLFIWLRDFSEMVSQLRSSKLVPYGLPFSISKTSLQDRQPLLAFNRTDNNYVVVSFDHPNFEIYLQTQALQSTGDTLGHPKRFKRSNRDYSIGLVHNAIANEYLVASLRDIPITNVDSRATYSFATFDRLGRKISGPLTIPELTKIEYADLQVTFDEVSNRYFAVWNSNGRVWSQPFTKELVPLSRKPKLLMRRAIYEMQLISGKNGMFSVVALEDGQLRLFDFGRDFKLVRSKKSIAVHILNAAVLLPEFGYAIVANFGNNERLLYLDKRFEIVSEVPITCDTASIPRLIYNAKTNELLVHWTHWNFQKGQNEYLAWRAPAQPIQAECQQ